MPGITGFDHSGNYLPAVHPYSKTTVETFGDSYSEDQLPCSQNKVVNFLNDLMYTGLFGDRMFHLLRLQQIPHVAIAEEVDSWFLLPE